AVSPYRARLRGLEAPLVDLERLDLRLERGRRHTEPRRRTERSGHPALALPERGLDGVLPVRRERAVGFAVGRGSLDPPAGERPLIDREGVRVGHDHRALDDILKLADVARPVVALQQVRRLPADATDLPAFACGVAVDEVLDEQGNIRST